MYGNKLKDKRNYDLAIFDMDGTILNSIEDLMNSLNYGLECCGLPMRTLEEVTRFVGNGSRRLMESGVPQGTPAEVIDRVHRIFKEHYAIHYNDTTKPYEGILQLLEDLQAAECKTAVLSNKMEDAVKKLEASHFEGLFDEARGERPGVARKPAPDGIEGILQDLGVVKERTVYIGDSEVDLETAHHAGVDCLIVGWGFRSPEFLKERGAKEVLESPSQILKRIVSQ